MFACSESFNGYRSATKNARIEIQLQLSFLEAYSEE